MGALLKWALSWLTLLWIAAPTYSASPNQFDAAHPFRSVSKWLVQTRPIASTDSGLSDPGLEPSEEAIKRALLLLSKTQLFTKGVDGAAHHVSSRAGGSASRSNITAELAKLHAMQTTAASAGDPATGSAAQNRSKTVSPSGVPKPSAAAAKLVHKARVATQAFRAAELIELGQDVMQVHYDAPAADSAAKAEAYAETQALQAGASLLAPPVCLPVLLEDGNEVGHLCVLLLRDTRADAAATAMAETAAANGLAAEARTPEHITLVVCDSLEGASLLSALSESPATVSCRPPQRTLHTGSPLRASSKKTPLAGPTTEMAKAPVAATVLRSALAVQRAILPSLVSVLKKLSSLPAANRDATEAEDQNSRAASDKNSRVVLQCVGHSFSGSVAALLSGMLGGTLDGSGLPAENETGQPKHDATAKSAEGTTAPAPQAGDIMNFLAGPVSCVALGPCPCAGTHLPLPGCASLVLGDDLFARCSPQSLERLRVRVAKMLGSSDQSAMGAAARMGTALLGDAVGSTWKNLRQRKTTSTSPKPSSSPSAAAAAFASAGPEKPGMDSARTATGDTTSVDADVDDGTTDKSAALLCPGVVYLLKPRANGALGVITTKKGGLAESVLMQMHDVLLSQSMLAHHCLEAYIQAFDLI